MGLITCWMTGSSEVVVLYLIRSTSWRGFSVLVVIRSYDLSYAKRRPYVSLPVKVNDIWYFQKVQILTIPRVRRLRASIWQGGGIQFPPTLTTEARWPRKTHESDCSESSAIWENEHKYQQQITGYE